MCASTRSRVAAVCGQERLEDLLVLAAQLAGPHPIGRCLRKPRPFIDVRDQPLAHVAWQQQQRVLPNRALKLRDDPVFGQVCKGVALAELVRRSREADPRTLTRLRKNPREPIESAVVRIGIGFEPPHQARDERRFRAAVGPVKQDQPVGAPFPLEAVEDSIERLLRGFVPRETIAEPELGLMPCVVEAELEIEHLPALEVPGWPLDFVRAEKVHAVFEVPPRVAGRTSSWSTARTRRAATA